MVVCGVYVCRSTSNRATETLTPNPLINLANSVEVRFSELLCTKLNCITGVLLLDRQCSNALI